MYHVMYPLLCSAEPAYSSLWVSRAQVRGRGLMNAVVVREDQAPSAWDICMRLMQNGLLAKPTHGNIIRLAPPLTLTEEQVPELPLKPYLETP